MKKIKTFMLSIGVVAVIAAPIGIIAEYINNNNNHNGEEPIKLTKKEQIFTNNLQALKNKFVDGVATMKLDKASFIAKRIKNKETLKTETGIDLTSLADTSKYLISAKGTPEGVITVSVEMRVEGMNVWPSNADIFIRGTLESGAIVAYKTLKLNIYQRSDVELASDPKVKALRAVKDKIQAANLQALKDKLTTGIDQTVNNKAPFSAQHIISVAKLKNDTGIDLTGLANTSTYVISEIVVPNVAIVISVLMTTVRATKPASTILVHVIEQKNDPQVTKNKAQIDNL